MIQLSAVERVALADKCPHPWRRERAVILVTKPGREMALCVPCKLGFERMIAAWHRHELGPREIVARVRAMGYSRRDAVEFLLGLAATSIGVRLGFAKVA